MPWSWPSWVSLEVIRWKNKSDDERRHFNMHFRVSTGRQEEEKLLVRGFRLVWKITSDAAGQVEENSFDWHHSALFFLPGDGRELISEFSYTASIVVFIKRTCYLTELNIPWAANSAERVRGWLLEQEGHGTPPRVWRQVFFFTSPFMNEPACEIF